MDLKERYVYAVVSKLPEKQRDDIAKEIRTLIDDMMEQYEFEDESIKLEKVLLELGDPSQLADKYREQNKYLIGPKYYHKYIYTLKIVLISIVIAITVSSFIGIIFDNTINFASFTGDYISSLMSALFQGVVWVTVVFALFEYNKVNLSDSTEKWNPKKLQPVPNKKAVISRVETIVGIVFMTIFLILFYADVIAIYIPQADDKMEVVQIFNLDVLNQMKPLILVVFFLGIAKEILKLIYGKWSIRMAIYYTLLSVASTVLFIIIFTNPDIWNVNIYDQISQYINVENKIDILNHGDRFKEIFIAIVLFGTFIDVGTALFKGFKYNSAYKVSA